MTDNPERGEEIELDEQEIAASDRSLDRLARTDPRYKNPFRKGTQHNPAGPPDAAAPAPTERPAPVQ